MWVIEIRRWLDKTQSGPVDLKLKSAVSTFCEIITYATSMVDGVPTMATPKCWRRPHQIPCGGLLDIALNESTGQIYWQCQKCQDQGIITGWHGLIWDMSDEVGPVQ